jgi:uncharacterized protein YbjT (DUF2867 family)
VKIGVSGASGYLGRAVVSELLQRAGGHELVAITRAPSDSPFPCWGRVWAAEASLAGRAPFIKSGDRARSSWHLSFNFEQAN